MAEPAPLYFVSDAFGCGRRFRVLWVVDNVKRECLAFVPDTSLSGARGAHEIDATAAIRGKPLALVSANGTELTSTSILRWLHERQVECIGLRQISQPRTRSSGALMAGSVTSPSLRRLSPRWCRHGPY